MSDTKTDQMDFEADRTSDEYWKDVDQVAAGVGEIIRWDEPGQTFIGVYKGKDTVDTDDGEVEVYLFIDLNGEASAAWTSHDLAKKMDTVPEESLVRIEYVKDIETSRDLTPMKSFKVQAKF